MQHIPGKISSKRVETSHNRLYNFVCILYNVYKKVDYFMEEREKLKSRLGFILLSAGCAIGIGNVWKFPYHCRTGRRRCLCAVLSVVSDYSRTPDHDDGICGWACQPEKSGQSLPGTGKTRTEMAYPRDYHIDRLLSSYDVLYNGHRLDASLFLYDGHRTVSGTGCRRCIRTVYHNAEQTSDHGLLDGGSCLRRRICLLPVDCRTVWKK